MPVTRFQQLKKTGGLDPFVPFNYAANKPAPNFARATQRKGPHRCWFTRRAKVYALTCGGYTFGEAFAGSFLRVGAYVYTTGGNVFVISKDFFLFQNPHWGFKPQEGKTRWYPNIDEFLQSPDWAAIPGRL